MPADIAIVGDDNTARAAVLAYRDLGVTDFIASVIGEELGLVGIALKHARRQGWIDRTSPVALIGDHPNDIRAARANGVRAVAVGTGLIGEEELARHQPDILVPDMRALSLEVLLRR